jgi:hypothetical protein
VPVKLSNLSTKLSLSLVAAAVAAAGLVAYAQPKAGPAPTSPAATVPAATEPVPLNPIIASINNAGLRRDDFTNILIAAGGLRVFDEYWGYAVVMQAVEQSGITVTKEDVQKVKDDIAKKIVVAGAGATTGPATTAKDLTPEEKDKAIYKVLVERGIATNPQIDWYFGTYAGLQILADKVAKEQVTPTKAELEQVVAATFGEKATLIDFIVKDETEGGEVITLLQKGEEPQAVANKGHQARETTVAKEDKSIPAAFITQIFDKLKPKTCSSLPQKDTRPGGLWHVFYLERKEAARVPTDVEKAKAEEAFTDAKASNWRAQHLNKLKMLSVRSVRINDPILEAQFNGLIAQLEAQQKAAASQAAALATQPATMPNK